MLHTKISSTFVAKYYNFFCFYKEQKTPHLNSYDLTLFFFLNISLENPQNLISCRFTEFFFFLIFNLMSQNLNINVTNTNHITISDQTLVNEVIQKWSIEFNSKQKNNDRANHFAAPHTNIWNENYLVYLCINQQLYLN